MSSARRTKVRKSMLAMLVSFLRDDTLDTSKFTAVAGVVGSYPFGQNVWSFPLGQELYLIAYGEMVGVPLSPGVTLEFGLDRAAIDRAMPQIMNLALAICIRVPLALIPTQESVAQQIALKIDQALFQCGSKCEIKDYDVNPAVTTGTFANWVRVPRGAWTFEKADGPFEYMRLEMELQYPQPQDEWE